MSFKEQMSKGQISKLIIVSNGGCCVKYPSNILHNTCSFKIMEDHLDIEEF